MPTNTSDQGLIIPANTDVNNFATGVGSLIGADPTTGVSGTGGVESRLVKRYLSAADRAARNPTPSEGELSYLMDINVLETYTGTVWTWPYSKGVIGGTRYTGTGNLASGVGTSELFINMQSGNQSLEAGRTYRVNTRIKGLFTNSSAVSIVHLRQNSISGGVIGENLIFCNSTSFGFQWEISARFDSASAQTMNFVVCLNCNVGSLTITGGGTTSPAYVEVEDIGPSGKMTIQSTP